MNPQRADDIRDRIRHCPKQIRVLCPRGHFIADVWLEVPDSEDYIAMWPLSFGRRPRSNAGWYGFWMSIAHSNVVRRKHSQSWKCATNRCTYDGRLGYDSLALKLAEAALAGDTEHRLAA